MQRQWPVRQGGFYATTGSFGVLAWVAPHLPPPLCLSVQLAPPMRLVTFVAEAGGVAEAMLMAPWRHDCDRSPFCEEGKMWGV